MNTNLSEAHHESQLLFRAFVDEAIAPFANRHDLEERISRDVITLLARKGYLGATVSKEHGGLGMDFITFGLLNEEIGRGCSSVRSLITVQSMVTQVIERWGSNEQISTWLRPLASGEIIAAFALSEPEYGSDAANIQTEIKQSDGTLIINGHKKWISFGQLADLFLAFGQSDGKLGAFLIEKNTPGLSIKPITGLLGVRGAMLAELHFENCKIPETNLIGNIGFGLTPIGFTALDMGRYSIACGCIGLAQNCLETCIKYTKERKQFDAYLKKHQMIQEKIANMVVDIRAGRLLCYNAGQLKQVGDRNCFTEMLIAKYYAANMAVRIANTAVEIHGANGYSRDYPVERLLRDAKIMETIEGTNQMLQIMIARNAYREYRKI